MEGGREKGKVGRKAPHIDILLCNQILKSTIKEAKKKHYL